MQFTSKHNHARSFLALMAALAAASGWRTTSAAENDEAIYGSGFEPGETIQMPGPCDGFYVTGTTLLEGMVNPAASAGTKPPKGVPLADAGFGTCMVRATQHDVEPPPTFARNDYSRRQPFNADNSRILVYSQGGFWHLYDANTLAYVERLNGPAGDAEPQWHPTDPNTLYFLPTNGGLKIFALDIRSNTARTVADFTGRLPWADASHLWTKSEGSPSRDARYWGFQAEATNNFDIRGFVVYDLQQDRIVGTRNSSDRPDHVSMTPSGRWFTSSSDNEGTFAWSLDFSVKKKLLHKSEHSDLAVGPDGHDYYVSIDFQSNNGDVFFVDIDNCPAVPADTSPASVPECPRTVLFPTYLNGATTSVHVSGKAYGKPGWALISSFATNPSRDGSWPWFTNKLFAVELTASPRVYGLGYHQVTRYEGYWTEPHAAVNRDFTRLMFNSNWNSSSDTDVDDYMIEIPAGAIPSARTSTPASRSR